MKRFLVFSFDKYYPSGGAQDFKASFETKEQAMEYALSLDDNIIQIYDSIEHKIVIQKDRF
jgi:hypothetical protein